MFQSENTSLLCFVFSMQAGIFYWLDITSLRIHFIYLNHINKIQKKWYKSLNIKKKFFCYKSFKDHIELFDLL